MLTKVASLAPFVEHANVAHACMSYRFADESFANLVSSPPLPGIVLHTPSQTPKVPEGPEHRLATSEGVFRCNLYIYV